MILVVDIYLFFCAFLQRHLVGKVLNYYFLSLRLYPQTLRLWLLLPNELELEFNYYTGIYAGIMNLKNNYTLNDDESTKVAFNSSYQLLFCCKHVV